MSQAAPRSTSETPRIPQTTRALARLATHLASTSRIAEVLANCDEARHLDMVSDLIDVGVHLEGCATSIMEKLMKHRLTEDVLSELLPN